MRLSKSVLQGINIRVLINKSLPKKSVFFHSSISIIFFVDQKIIQILSKDNYVNLLKN